MTTANATTNEIGNNVGNFGGSTYGMKSISYKDLIGEKHHFSKGKTEFVFTDNIGRALRYNYLNESIQIPILRMTSQYGYTVEDEMTVYKNGNTYKCVFERHTVYARGRTISVVKNNSLQNKED